MKDLFKYLARSIGAIVPYLMLMYKDYLPIHDFRFCLIGGVIFGVCVELIYWGFKD